MRRAFKGSVGEAILGVDVVDGYKSKLHVKDASEYVGRHYG